MYGVVWICIAVTISLSCVHGRDVRKMRTCVQGLVPRGNISHPSVHNDHPSHQQNLVKNVSKNLTNIQRRRKMAKKQSFWRTISNAVVRRFLEDDYYDSSSSASREDDRDSVSESREQPTIRSYWESAKNLLTQRKNKISCRPERNHAFTTLSPSPDEDKAGMLFATVEQNEDLTEMSAGGGSRVIKEIKAVGAKEANADPIESHLHKVFSRQDELENPLLSLAELRKEVKATGKKLLFIEYAAILEIMVLVFIAAKVFRTVGVPVPVPFFTKPELPFAAAIQNFI